MITVTQNIATKKDVVDWALILVKLNYFEGFSYCNNESAISCTYGWSSE
jgi:hypothetical protein